MPSSCEFEFNKNQPIYYSGEIICGTITLITSSDKRVKDISIIFQGEGKVKWTSVNSHYFTNIITNSDYITNNKSHETYIDNSTNVYGDGVLPKGKHIYNFNIQLPFQCPTSIEGKYGHIRYEIVLKVHRYFHSDNVYKKPITIIKTKDLNLNPIYKRPVTADTVKTLCGWPCSSGDIIFIIVIPFSAFAVGQTLKYALHIKNQSMSNVVGYLIQFTRKIVYTANSPSKTTCHTKDVLVSNEYIENCLCLTNRIIEREICIPSTPPTSSEDDIIYVSYNFKVVLQLSGWSSNIELNVPIIIGTIPIRESLPNYQGIPNNVQQQTEQTTTGEEITEENVSSSYMNVLTSGRMTDTGYIRFE